MPRARTGDGHSLRREEGCSWCCCGTEHPGPCSEPEGTACAHTLALSTVPLHALPCLTKVTATLWLWPELLDRGWRRCPPCRQCLQPTVLSPALPSLPLLEK